MKDSSKNLIQEHLLEPPVLQLATVSGNQPWVVSVYFVADKDLNLYWLSLPSRRHSRELHSNIQAAITIAIKTEQPVIGISAEGRVSEVKSLVNIKKVITKYIKKYNEGHHFVDNFLAQKNQHSLYKFNPSRYVLFDEMNHPSQPRKIFHINSASRGIE